MKEERRGRVRNSAPNFKFTEEEASQLVLA